MGEYDALEPQAANEYAALEDAGPSLKERGVSAVQGAASSIPLVDTAVAGYRAYKGEPGSGGVDIASKAAGDISKAAMMVPAGAAGIGKLGAQALFGAAAGGVVAVRRALGSPGVAAHSIAHGQWAGRWSVTRRADRVSRPTRPNSRRRRVWR